MSDPEKPFSVQEYLDNGDAFGWFDDLYARAEGNPDGVPWAHLKPRPAFAEWLVETDLQGNGRTALVVACGLGDDAEALAARGFAVTAFDISATAIEWCKKRFSDSTVDYQVGDMFKPPAKWVQGFDLVVEVFTVQALPIDMRAEAVGAVAQFVAPGGTLFALYIGRESTEGRTGPPWPFVREEIDYFKRHGLAEERFDRISPSDGEGSEQWRVVYRR